MRPRLWPIVRLLALMPMLLVSARVASAQCPCPHPHDDSEDVGPLYAEDDSYVDSSNHLIFRNFYGLYPGGPCFDGRSTVGGLHHDGTADTADTWEFKSAGANFQEHLSFTLGNGFVGQYTIDSCRLTDKICLGASYPIRLTCSSSTCTVKASLPLDITNNYYAVVHITGTEEPPTRARSYTLHLLQ